MQIRIDGRVFDCISNGKCEDCYFDGKICPLDIETGHPLCLLGRECIFKEAE